MVCGARSVLFEADLQPEQYAYRADRSALDAVRLARHHRGAFLHCGRKGNRRKSLASAIVSTAAKRIYFTRRSCSVSNSPDTAFLDQTLTREAKTLRTLGRPEEAAKIEQRLKSLQPSAANNPN